MVELLDILEKLTRQILHMVFIKLLELFKEVNQAFIKQQALLYKVILME